ncbi:YfiR family protein [Agaribacterium haliotis]|uniref:YfiR family protein n=1 Tax=Agaribacterium haliotis TaxID=2013869 RepID=UPI000BB56BEB|nr:YfiR family protein [Agaribacterium haliotis]
MISRLLQYKALALARFLALIFYSILSVSVKASATESGERVKAQFVYNFVNYVTWPDDAFVSEKSSIELCLFGQVGFEPYLRAFEGVLVGERALTIISTDRLEQIADGCHLLFVSEQQRVLLPRFWQQINYSYVLSVGEKSEFAEKGGIISIFRTKDRLRFDINISNAINNGLFLDSDLLSLARTIRRNTEEQ